MARTIETPPKTLPPGIAKMLKRLHQPLEVMLLCVRWYVSCSLRLRNLEEMVDERDMGVDRSLVHRRVVKLVSLFEKTFRKYKRLVGKSWRVDESYIKVKGSWTYLCCAVDRVGNTIDFLIRARRDKAAARRFFEKAINRDGPPETVSIDRSDSNLAGLTAANAERERPIKFPQIKYLNNIVEQERRAIKRRTRPMLGFKAFSRARIILRDIKLMHMISCNVRAAPVVCRPEIYLLVS